MSDPDHFHFHHATLTAFTLPSVITDGVGAAVPAPTTHAALRRKTTTAAEVSTLSTQLRVALATGGVTLLTQGMASGWLLLAVAVLAPRTDRREEQSE